MTEEAVTLRDLRQLIDLAAINIDQEILPQLDRIEHTQGEHSAKLASIESIQGEHGTRLVSLEDLLNRVVHFVQQLLANVDRILSHLEITGAAPSSP